MLTRDKQISKQEDYLDNNRDMYYTLHPELIVKIWKENIYKYCEILKGELLIEPSAGDGRFAKYIHFDKMYDIQPLQNISKQEQENTTKQNTSNQNIIKQDFLTTTDLNAHYLGNPPFGVMCNLANKFIRHCCKNSAKSISFILPRSFKKDSMKKVFDKYYHLVFEMDYDKFETPDGKLKTVPCVFQIWVKKDFERAQTIRRMTNQYFEFIPSKNIPSIINTSQNDISINTNSKNVQQMYNIRRVGITAGKLSPGVNVAPSSHYFIKFNDNVDVEKFIQEYNRIEFVCDKNTGQKSLSKPELNEYLEQIDKNVVLKFDPLRYYNQKLVEEYSDDNMITEYVQQDNFIQKCFSLYTILKKLDPQSNITLEQLQYQNEIQKLLISPQSKASLRGNKFNKYVFELCKKEYINVKSEVKVHDLDEIVDCVVFHDNKVIYIYNQIDLFNGGEQLNRAGKYLNLKRNDVILVILDKPQTNNGKAMNYLKQGIKEKKLCFVDGLFELLRDKFESL